MNYNNYNINEDHPHSLCADAIQKRGITINEKPSLKALATMIPGFEMHQDRLKPGSTCIVPNDVTNTYGIFKSDNSCSMVTPNRTHTLPLSRQGVLPLDSNEHPRLLNEGRAVYPNNGCVVNASDVVNINNFTNDFGSLIDFQNNQTLQRLNLQLAALTVENERLQNDINYESNRRNNKQNDLMIQQNLCTRYRDDRPWYRGQINSLTSQISTRRQQIRAAEIEAARRAAEAEAARRAAEVEAVRRAAAAAAAFSAYLSAATRFKKPYFPPPPPPKPKKRR